MTLDTQTADIARSTVLNAIETFDIFASDAANRAHRMPDEIAEGVVPNELGFDVHSRQAVAIDRNASNFCFIEAQPQGYRFERSPPFAQTPM
jgi:hypothetical protein